MVLDNLIHDHNDGRKIRLGTLPYFLLDAPHDLLPCLSWSRIWREAVKYEAKYRVGNFDGYFVKCHNREILKFSPEEREKLYVRVRDW